MKFALCMLAAVVVAVVDCASDISLHHATTGRTATCEGGYYKYGLIGMANASTGASFEIGRRNLRQGTTKSQEGDLITCRAADGWRPPAHCAADWSAPSIGLPMRRGFLVCCLILAVSAALPSAPTSAATYLNAFAP